MLKWSLSQIETPKRYSNRRKSLTSSNKENIVTSTPLRKFPGKMRDLLEISTSSPSASKPPTRRPSVYASTLPKFEEEYSPSTTFQSGQVLAMRGLLPDRYMGNPRYLAKDNINSTQDTTAKDQPTLSSSKMSDFTLDKLIDAILDSNSTRKSPKKRSRRSINLRRRTLTRNTPAVEVLSPSYTPADDPASDLSFSEINVLKRRNSSPKKKLSRLSSPRKCTESNINASYLEVGLALPSLYV